MYKYQRKICFWQNIISPHVAGLASALAKRGHHVTYVATQPMSARRLEHGWVAQDIDGVELVIAQTRSEARQILKSLGQDVIHVREGIRGEAIAGRRLFSAKYSAQNCWILMETVRDEGLRGAAKKICYRVFLSSVGQNFKGILAIGSGNSRWLEERGVSPGRVFPFAYFLPHVIEAEATKPADGVFRILFVGQLIRRKRLDLLIDSIVKLESCDVELTVVGSGPLEKALKAHACQCLSKIRWLGVLQSSAVGAEMSRADLLVLPSDFDGWGAVAVEAMQHGTAAIVSDRCGVSEVVRASGRGDVFSAGDSNSLAIALNKQFEAFSHAFEAEKLAEWAACLSCESGAKYTEEIFACAYDGENRPIPPWEA